MISNKTIVVIKILLLLLFRVFVTGDAEVRCIESEKEALLSFKNGLIDKHGILSSWRSDDCCKWHGIECSYTTGHVIALQPFLNSSAKLSGMIGSSLLELHHLIHLDLSWNDFGGIPIPEFIGSMKQLQHLFLQLSNFSGSISPWLGNLTNLRSLDLSNNSLSSISPLILGSVFESLEILNLSHNKFNESMPDLRAFPSLIQLHLKDNNFIGSITLSMGQLSTLQVLDLSYNSLEGSVPLSIGQLSKLLVLDISHNSLEGLISESHFSKLDNLKVLDLSYNPLLILDIAIDWSPPFQLDAILLAWCNVGPYFPKWLRTQKYLAYLNLNGANIIDEAPRWLGSMFPRLKELSLSYNQISGTIPNLTSNIMMWYLDLSYNQFEGSIPFLPPYANAVVLSGNMLSGSISSICNTDHYALTYLDLSSNQLAGEVPNCGEKISELQFLNLANNSFSGQIPSSFGVLRNLRALQMHGNDFSGKLPYNLRHCQELILLDVGGNKLIGEIPTWIGQLYQMQILNFRGNKLHGSIPPEICNLTSIQVLDLSINNLSSIIPDCFNEFTLLASENMSYFYPITFPVDENLEYEYSTFQWKGKESEYRKNLKLLKLIDLSSNRLTGNIPKSFSHMSYIYSLNLSRNSLTGHIIPDIGNMEVLNSLDLSHNQLFGNIPASLAEIHSLGFLDLSNNNLSGKIPTGTQLQSFIASFYADNDGLCGDPLPKCPGDILRPSTTNPVGNMNEKDGINFSFMQEVGISMGFGFIFGFWGVIGSFILKKSWRITFFNLFDAAGDWFSVRKGLLCLYPNGDEAEKQR